MKTTTARLLRILALLCASTTAPLAYADKAPSDDNLLTLSATASVEVTRDVLNLSFSTQREGADAATVQAQLMQALEPALAEARKIAKPGQVEVSTGSFSVYPRRLPNGGAMQWQGTVEMLVEGRDTGALAGLVGRVRTLSVARVGYSLSREARDKVQAEVSAEAIARFRRQAESHARAFGFSAYTLRSVELSTNESGRPPMPVFRASAAGGAMASDAALPVEAGTASVSSTVSGTVQLK